MNFIRKNILVLLILILSLFLNIYGIWWGVPNEDIANIVFGSKDSLNQMAEEMKVSRDEIYKTFRHYSGRWDSSEFSKIHKERAKTEKWKIDAMRTYLLRSYGTDEQIPLVSLSNMKPSKFNFLPGIFVYGGLYIYGLGAFLKSCSILHLINLNSDELFYLLHPAEMGKLYIFGRLFGAIFCSLTVWVIYLIGSFLYNRKVGLIAAFLFVVTPAVVQQSHYLRPYAFGLFWLMLSFYYSVRILKSDEKRLYILAGIFAGLAAGSLTTYGIALLFIPIAHFLRDFSAKKISRLLLGIICFAAALLIVNPYYLITPSEVIAEFKMSKNWWGFHPSPERLFYFVRHNLLDMFKLPLWIAVAAGFIYSLYKRKKEDILILSILIPLTLYMAFTTTYNVHYSLPLVPFLILLGARFFDEMIYNEIPLNPPFTKGGIRGIRRLNVYSTKIKHVIIISLVAVISYTFIYSFSWDRIAAKRNVKTEAGEWIMNNIEPGASIGLVYHPSPFNTPPFNPFKYKIIPTDWNKEVLAKEKPSYFIVEEYTYLPHGSLKDLEDFLNNYEVIKDFEKNPKFLGLEFKRRENRPIDSCFVNPEILIFRRKK